MAEPTESVRIKTEPVVGALSALEAVRAVLCFGSYAIGAFDEHSDIDLYALCHPAIIGSQVRREAFQRIPGATELEIGYGKPEWDNQWCPAMDRFRLHGVLMDIGWNTVDWARTVVRKVTEQGCMSLPELRFRPYTMLGLLENSVVLYDPDSVLLEMRLRLRPYPPKLKQALLSQSLPILQGSPEELKNYARRSVGNTAFHFHLQRAIDALGTALLALNERYDPATKHVERVYGTLRMAPADFLERYNRMLKTPLTQSGRGELVQELEALARELEELIDKAREAGAMADVPHG